MRGQADRYPSSNERTGGAGMAVDALRVTFWGALAIRTTAGVGALFGAPVG